jgi:hypothetical protein
MPSEKLFGPQQPEMIQNDENVMHRLSMTQNDKVSASNFIHFFSVSSNKFGIS